MTQLITVTLPGKGGNIYLNDLQRDAVLALGMALLRAAGTEVKVAEWVGYGGARDGWQSTLFLTLKTGREREISYERMTAMEVKGIATLRGEGNGARNSWGDPRVDTMLAAFTRKGWLCFGLLLADAMTEGKALSLGDRGVRVEDMEGPTSPTVDMKRFALLWDESHGE